MTGTDIARTTTFAQRQSVQLTTQQLEYIAGTEFVPKGLRGNMPAILACVATGRELGIGDMTALKSIHVIDGRPTFSAELMVLLVRRAGHSISGKVGADTATVTGTRADNGDTMEVTWTTEMAKRAGLLSKQNWVKYTESMLWARAVSQLCRMLFADCFAGATYTAEELEGVDGAALAEPGAGDDGASGAPSSASADDDGLFPPKDQPRPGMALASEAQKKKLNVLVGKLRPDVVSTEQLWERAGKNPWPEEIDQVGQRLRWSPLRDLLTKQEASTLIEWLTEVEAQALGGSGSVSAATGVEPGPPNADADLWAQTETLTARLQELHDSNPDVADYIENHRRSHQAEPFAHVQWLERQIGNAEAKAKA